MLLLIAVSAAVSSAAGAQDTRSDAVACRDTATLGLYRRCALWLDGGKIRRGEEGITVARLTMFRPAALRRVVAADSAMRYARQYERGQRRSTVLTISGVALMVAGKGFEDCNDNFLGCEGPDDTISLGMFIGGAAATIVGAALRARAYRAAVKSIWWNNERFTR